MATSGAVAKHELSGGFDDDLLTQAVLNQCLMRFGDTQLPRKSRIVNGGHRSGAGSSVVSTDQDHLGAGLGDAGSDGSDTGFGHKLDGDSGPRISVFQVKN